MTFLVALVVIVFAPALIVTAWLAAEWACSPEPGRPRPVWRGRVRRDRAHDMAGRRW